MPEIRVGKDESFDRALRRFKRECQRSGILRDLRKREHYESPSVKRKKKAEAARARRKPTPSSGLRFCSVPVST